MELNDVVMVRVGTETAVPAIIVARRYRGNIECVPLIGQLLTERQLSSILDRELSCVAQSAGHSYLLVPREEITAEMQYAVRVLA